VIEGPTSCGIHAIEKVRVDTTIPVEKNSILVDEMVMMPEGKGVEAAEETSTVKETPSGYYIPAADGADTGTDTGTGTSTSTGTSKGTGTGTGTLTSAGEELPKTYQMKYTPTVGKPPVTEESIATEHSNTPGMRRRPGAEMNEGTEAEVSTEVSTERADEALVVKERSGVEVLVSTDMPISTLPLATKTNRIGNGNDKLVAILDNSPHVRAFGELFSVVMAAFSGFYVAARPATVMEFNSVLKRFFQQLERAASKGGKKKSQKALAAFLDCSQYSVGQS
jgi:hypothetical protein